MRNEAHFRALLSPTLRSVPYILQSHACKGYLALENLRAEYPDWPMKIWDYCADVICDDEPKVEGLIIPELLDVPAMVDHTSGREFGPDWILEHGLMPLSYWAMKKKIETLGVETVFHKYLAAGLDHPIYLGHELSVLASYWLFYQGILADSEEDELMQLFIQRFTEYALVTFGGQNDWVYEHPEISAVPSETELLRELLMNPDFFGHHVLAYVWTMRIRSEMSDAQYQAALYNLTVHARWRPNGEEERRLQPLPIPEGFDDDALLERILRFFFEGPRNIHQITLADALLSIWRSKPSLRGLCLSNIEVFTQGVRPPLSNGHSP